MSVKTMLPILGVGSAFAILGLAAARRHQTHHSQSDDGVQRRHRPSSGVHPRVTLDSSDGDGFERDALRRGQLSDAELEAMSPELTSDFWDASPESYSLEQAQTRSANEFESYDTVDTEDLTAEWLTRATQAPSGADLGAFDLDDPAEIPADSISMISDASRHAAARGLDDMDATDDEPADSRS